MSNNEYVEWCCDFHMKGGSANLTCFEGWQASQSEPVSDESLTP